MYSVFGVRNSPSLTNIQQENSVAARKPGLSTRKPFADRKCDNQEPAVFVKPKHNVSPKKPDYELFDIDLCSYKDVPDNYEDIYTSGLLYDSEDINNISSLFFGKIPKTPPVQKSKSPALNRIKTTTFSDSFNYDLIRNDLKSMNFNEFDLETAPIPEFD